MNIDLSGLPDILGDLTLESIASAAVTLLVCLIVIRILLRIVRRALRHTQIDERLQKFLLTGLKALMYIVTVIIVAQSLGVPSSSLVALLGVASLAVSLGYPRHAVQPGRRHHADDLPPHFPGRPGRDRRRHRQCGGDRPDVHKTAHRRRPDRDAAQLQHLRRKIINYTTLGRRRITVRVGASYNAAVNDVRAALLDAAQRTEHLLSDPAPTAYVESYGDSAVNYVLYAWATADDYWETHFVLTAAVKENFDRAGIEIPYNQLDVRIVGGAKPEYEKSARKPEGLRADLLFSRFSPAFPGPPRSGASGLPRPR